MISQIHDIFFNMFKTTFDKWDIKFVQEQFSNLFYYNDKKKGR